MIMNAVLIAFYNIENFNAKQTNKLMILIVQRNKFFGFSYLYTPLITSHTLSLKRAERERERDV